MAGRLLRPTLAILGCLVGSRAWAGGGELPALIHDIGYAVLLAGVLAIFFSRLKIPTIAAFLAAGVLAGPFGARIVTDPANIDTIAQLGLVLLLFLIGLEIDFSKLKASGKTLIISGLLQVPLSVAFGFAVAHGLLATGLASEALAGSDYVPLYIGLLLASSSTLLVVKLLQEHFQMDTVSGRIALGLLIFQDIWAIIVIAVQPNLANPELLPILMTFVGIGLLSLLAVLFAKYLMPVGFRWVSKQPEIILITSLAWCFLVVFTGMSLDRITEVLLGSNLHLAVGPAMGALIAGASVANLPYNLEIIGKVGVLKDFFVTLFFVGLGATIPLPPLPETLVLAAIFVILAVLIRYLVYLPLLYFTGLDRRNAFVASTRLAQISEFALVIAFLGMQLGHISDSLNSAIIFAFVITALVTPTLFRHADELHTRLGPILNKLGLRAPGETGAGGEEHFHLALLGFHRVASSLLHEISTDYPYLLTRTLVVDFNVRMHKKIAALGPTVRYGDLSNIETLHHAGIDKARVIVCTIPDDMLVGTTNRKLVKAIRHINPEAVIIANAITLSEAKRLYETGANFVFLPRIEVAKAMNEAIYMALAGEIVRHRDEVHTAHGPLQERKEVFD
jgi:Kef-type K+ transport system membrane component KefB